MSTSADPVGLDEIIERRLIRSVFQPIVDLDSGDVVAYEALSRGPKGPFETPDVLFQAARVAGRLPELDELCRRTALASAISAGIFTPLTLFVNVEPSVLDSARLEELVALAEDAPGNLQVVLEITERAIASRPAELLATVSRLRAAGWRIALDDVGAQDMSVAFMPLLHPAIVKLDLPLVQQRPGPAVAEIMNAVNAYAERSGAVLLAEGVEDEGHLEMARALGARLGQGWMFGHPLPAMPSHLRISGLRLPLPTPPTPHGSPFDCLPAHASLRRTTKPLLVELSKFLEREAMHLGKTCMVISAFQQARHFTAATAYRYRELVQSVGFVAAIGDGLGPEPVAGLRGADLHPDDPVRREWNVIVLAPHFCAALLARDLGDQGPDLERRFEFALTYDRDVTAAAAESLLSRVKANNLTLEPFAPAGLLSLSPDIVRLEALNGSRDGTPRTNPLDVSEPDGAQSRDGSHRTITDRTLRHALAATSNGVTIVDVTATDQPLIYVNTAFEKLAGLRAEDVLGRNCRILAGPDTDPAAITRMRDAIAEGREVQETVLNYRGPDRLPWWNELRLSPVFNDDGHLIQYIGIQHDVTASRHVDAELSREQ